MTQLDLNRVRQSIKNQIGSKSRLVQTEDDINL